MKDLRSMAGLLALCVTASLAHAAEPASLPAHDTSATPLTAAATVPPHDSAAPGIDALVIKHAHDYGVPLNLAKAVIRIESRGNPRARNHGAMGLMQIKADTARQFGFGGVASGLLLPDINLRYGMQYLATAYKASSGDLCRTLAYYQSGHPVHRLSRAGRAYCARAKGVMGRA